MPTDSGPAHIILDFDGTCTQIPPIFEAYLDLYCKGLNESGLNVALSEWRDAQATVRQHSPQAGWTVAGWPSALAAGGPAGLSSGAGGLNVQDTDAYSRVQLAVGAYECAPWRVVIFAVLRTV